MALLGNDAVRKKQQEGINFVSHMISPKWQVREFLSRVKSAFDFLTGDSLLSQACLCEGLPWFHTHRPDCNTQFLQCHRSVCHKDNCHHPHRHRSTFWAHQSQCLPWLLQDHKSLFPTFCLKVPVQEVSNSHRSKKAFSYTIALQMKAAKQSHIQTLERNYIYEGEAELRGVNQSWVKHFQLTMWYFKQNKKASRTGNYSASCCAVSKTCCLKWQQRQIFSWCPTHTTREEAANSYFEKSQQNVRVCGSAGNTWWHKILPGWERALSRVRTQQTVRH